MPRTVRVQRTSCEQCGGWLSAEPEFYVVHESRTRTLKCCRGCLEDRWARLDAEARWQTSELEFFWTLDATRGDDGDTDDPRRRVPIP